MASADTRPGTTSADFRGTAGAFSGLYLKSGAVVSTPHAAFAKSSETTTLQSGVCLSSAQPPTFPHATPTHQSDERRIDRIRVVGHTPADAVKQFGEL
jgi:hypothetical protein